MIEIDATKVDAVDAAVIFKHVIFKHVIFKHVPIQASALLYFFKVRYRMERRAVFKKKNK